MGGAGVQGSSVALSLGPGQQCGSSLSSPLMEQRQSDRHTSHSGPCLCLCWSSSKHRDVGECSAGFGDSLGSVLALRDWSVDMGVGLCREPQETGCLCVDQAFS